jgi:hypothetical protein
VPDDAEEKVVNQWLIEPENALPEITVDSLPEISKAACQKAGWKDLMPVQARQGNSLCLRRYLTLPQGHYFIDIQN